MAVYLSPGVYANEIDVSYVVTGFGQLRPALIGTAKKGPMNEPVYITNAQQFIDTFGEPDKNSYLGYSTLAYLEEGNQCYIERVGVEWDEALPTDLANIAIDTSGQKRYGWGRIPVFSGIDNGKISLKVPTAESMIEFHNEAVTDIEYNDIDATTPASATLSFTGVGLSDTYTGATDDSFIVLITDGPTATGGAIDGAEYQIIRNSDGETISEGVVTESTTPGESTPIQVGSGDDDTGLIFKIVVTAGALDEQDSFTFSAQPNNRKFGFWVDREEDSSGPVITEYTMPANAWYDGETAGHTLDDLVDDLNALDAGSGALSGVEEYKFVNYGGVLYAVTDDPGASIQLMPTTSGAGEAWALEMGKSLYSWDIPRAKLVGTDFGPFNISSSSNRVKINSISDDETTSIEFSVGVGNSQPVADIATYCHAGGVYNGQRYFRSYALQVSDSSYVLVIEADPTNQYASIEMMANFTNLKTLKFAQEVEIAYPYKDSYDGFTDPRQILPEQGTNPATPASCEADPLSVQCSADSDYYEHIVGYIVASTPGTWIDDYTVSISLFTEGVGDISGRYKITITDTAGNTVENIEDVSFDKNNTRYIANLINPGSTLGGVNGNSYINWIERPTELANDINDSSNYEVRNPSAMSFMEFTGAADGIPTDPVYSSELDKVVIGNPALATGVFAFENPESYDINLLATPGFSSGSVIGQAIQMCQSRGDVLYIVDSPYGLRPQQVVDWHNGMLLSDLRQAIDSSYASLYWSWLNVYDQFSGEYIWIPPSGHALSVFARTSRVSEQWFAPAGLRRGRLITPIDVEYSPTQPERDLLYGSGNAVNPIVNFPQDGIVVWGQRTLQRQASALDRVNVRMLLSYIKKNLTRNLRPYVFEQNDEVTWEQARTISQSFMADIKARRGVEDFRVVCDDSINTAERRDRNEMWISIFLKPTKAIEYIVLNLVVMRSTQSFAAEEILSTGGVVTT